MDKSNLIARALKKADIGLVITVPDEWAKALIEKVHGDAKFRLVYATREEEAVGIATGAQLGGLNAAIIMQNSGLGNSINALASLSLVYRIPLLILASYRGGPGEEFLHKMYIGLSTKDILHSLGIPCFELTSSANTIEVITGAFSQAVAWNIPVVVLMHKKVLVEREK